MNIINELVANAETENLQKKQRIEKAKKDFGFFCTYYLADYFYEQPAQYQRVLYEVADNRAVSPKLVEQIKPFVRTKYQPLIKPTEHLAGAMFIEPREHGKTVRWSFAYAMWCAISGRSKFVLLIGANRTAACENLENIKNEIEENDRLYEDFGELKGTLWTNEKIELSNKSRIQAKGSGMAMRGVRYRQYRPDLIILDDILKDDAVESYTQRSKIYRWLKKVVLNLGKDAFIVWVNTIFHNDDPISRMLAEVEQDTLKRWVAVRLSCLKEDGTPLWHEHWTIEELEEKRQTIGEAVFSTEYMNEPLSDEERIIHPEWIAEFQYEVLPQKSRLQFFMGVDPATGAHDGTAEVPVARDKDTGIIYVLPCFAKACSEVQTVEQMILLHRAYNFASIAWENVAFSGIYGNYIQKLGAERSVYLPIVKVGTGTASKEMRIRSYSMLIQNGFIRFPKTGCTNIIKQLTEFPMGAFDDLCDGLYLAIKAAETAGTGHTAVHSIKAKARTRASTIINRARRF